MHQRAKEICEIVLDFNKKGEKPHALKIQRTGKIPYQTFFSSRKQLIANGILIPQDDEGLIVYKVDKKKYREELKKKKLTITEQARELGVSRATIYNRRNKLKK